MKKISFTQNFKSIFTLKLIIFLMIFVLSKGIYSQQSCPVGNSQAYMPVTCTDQDLVNFDLFYFDYLEAPGINLPYVIPVVFHVLENDNGTTITDAQIIDALEEVNIDFETIYNSSNVSGITFFLAGQNENEEPTTGIIRHAIGNENYGITEMGWRGEFQWNPEEYLNVFIIDDGNFSGAAASLAYWINCAPEEDGVAMRLISMTNGKKTLAHEIGHYLGLFHVHNDNNDGTSTCFECRGYDDPDVDEDDSWCYERGDRVCDTEPLFQLITGVNCDQEFDMCPDLCNNVQDQGFEIPKINIMGGYRSCRQGFTQGQVNRMYFSLETYRKNLWDNPVSISCLWESDDQYITGISTWPLGNHVINRNLIIKSGSSLTIEPNTTLSFCKDKGITVQPGATLDLRGTLTSCEGQWKGIEVWGTDNANISFPTPGNGKLITQIGSVLENAGTGIFLGGPIVGGNYTNTGGELEAYGTTFINNTKSIRIPPSNLSLRKYPADIVNCEFSSEGIFQFHSFIDLRGVQSVDIAGCNFDYTGPAMPSSAPYGYGIFASDASMNLTPNIISGTTGPIADESNFNGLSYGVYIAKVFANRSFTVEKANFTNCYTGIYNGGMNVGKILYNTFNLGSVPDPTLVGDNETSQLGLFLRGNITTLEVQENKYVGDGNTTFNTTGILADNTGSHIKTIRRNTFENLTISNLATRANGEETPEDGRGLRYACNDFGSSQYDIIVPKEATGGFLLDSKVNELQATIDEFNNPVSAGNLFSNPDVQYGDFNNEQENEDDFIEYRYFTEPENPDDALGIEAIASQISQCDLEYCEAPCPPNNDETNITLLDDAKDKFNDGKGINNNAHTQYEQGPSTPQDGEQLLLQISTTATQMADATDQALYILAANDDPANDPDLLWWIDAQETYLTDVWLAGEYAVRDQWSTTHQILYAIPNIYNLTNDQIAEYQSIVSIFNTVASEDVYNLSSTATNTLLSIKNTDKGNAQLFASNILSLNGIETLPEYYMPNLGTIRPRSSKPKVNQETIIYPNPATQKLNVVWDEEKGDDVLFKIFSVGNSLVFSGSTKAGTHIDVSLLSTGLYFVTLKYENGEESTHKILIVR